MTPGESIDPWAVIGEAIRVYRQDPWVGPTMALAMLETAYTHDYYEHDLRTAPGSDAASLGTACHAKAEDQGEAVGRGKTEPPRRDAAKPGNSYGRLHRWVWHAGPLHRDWRIYALGFIAGAAITFGAFVVVLWGPR